MFKHSGNAYLSLDVPPVLRLWLLRILVPLGGHKEFIAKNGFSNDNLAEVLGLGKWIDLTDQEFDQQKVRNALRRLHQDCEKSFGDSSPLGHLFINVERLADLVGLTNIDCRILEFAVLINNVRLLDDTADYLGRLTTGSVFRVLSELLSLSEQEVRLSLSSKGALMRSGLLTLDRNGSSSLREKLELLSECFADTISSEEIDPLSLLRGIVLPSAAPHLCLKDYGHIHSEISILIPYIKKSIEAGRKGVNVFLHGSPGTGKSQLAKVIAKELSAELFEVASEDADGDPFGGVKRLRAFSAAQSFFAQRRSLILFDEVEDVFNDGDIFFGRKSTAQTRKAWINRMLEENPVPTLWLSNSISCLDPAFIRRFDMVFELPVPPKQQRELIMLNCCGNLLSKNHIARIAESENLSPAVVARTTAVVNLITEELGSEGSERAFERQYNWCAFVSDKCAQLEPHPVHIFVM